MQFTIYHNPRCSKSRATLGLLEAATSNIDIVHYLEKPPSAEQLLSVAAALDQPLTSLVRKGDARKLNIELDATISEVELARLMAENPAIIERPIVIRNDGRAIVGRPPENVSALL